MYRTLHATVPCTSPGCAQGQQKSPGDARQVRAACTTGQNFAARTGWFVAARIRQPEVGNRKLLYHYFSRFEVRSGVSMNPGKKWGCFVKRGPPPVDIAELPGLIAGVNSHDRAQQREATVKVRKLLSIGEIASFPTPLFPPTAACDPYQRLALTLLHPLACAENNTHVQQVIEQVIDAGACPPPGPLQPVPWQAFAPARGGGTAD